MRRWLTVLLAVSCGALEARGMAAGVWKVAPHCDMDAATRTLETNGWRVVVLGTADLAEGPALEGLDAVLLPSGWDAQRLAGFRARRNLVRYVAGGGGFVECAVSDVRRPLFPTVGTTAGPVSGARLLAVGISRLAEAAAPFDIDPKAVLLKVRAGPAGEPFAAAGEDPVGLLGEPYAGRYVLFGGAFGALETRDAAGRQAAAQRALPAEDGKPRDELTLDEAGEAGPKGTASERLLLACMRWAASGPRPAAAERGRSRERADLDFLRAEERADWVSNEDLWSGGPLSVVPHVRRERELVLERRMHALEELGRSLAGDRLADCRALTAELQKCLDDLQARYRVVRANHEARIGAMSVDELTEDNPFASADSILKRVDAEPDRTDAEKAEMRDLVRRCASAEPPVDAPRKVALYLRGREVAEDLLPEARLREATARFNGAISELRAAVRAARPKPPGAVPERLRTDPLMAPYYTGRILPAPQRAEYRDEFIPMANVAVVVGRNVADPGPLVELLAERIERYGGRAAAVARPGAEHTAAVSLGDTDLARRIRGLPAVPARKEGYVVETTEAGGKPLVVLKGRDRLGLVWAIASFIQLIHWKDGRTLARAATVTDYPVLAKRGCILSGSDFFHPARDRGGRILSYPDTDLLLAQNRQFVLACKINEPCYQQLIVADCYGNDWKHPDLMPAAAHVEEDVAALGRSLTPLGVSWWAGIRPHAAGAASPTELSHKLCADEESVRALLHYACKAEEAGGHLAIILDDIRFPLAPYDRERLGTAREVDTCVITSVFARLKAKHPGARLLVCPPFYWGPLGMGWRSYGEDREAYLRTIGERWPPEVEVFWTGRQVNATTLAVREHYDWWTRLTRRKPYRWQNCAAYWCHLGRRHYPTDRLDSLWSAYWDGQFDLLGWYGFNGADIARYCVTHAISADFQWNPEAYVKGRERSAERSVREAAEKFIGAGSWPLLCDVTRPLSAFDEFYTEAKDANVRLAVNQAAARACDRLEDRRDETMAGLKALKERYPAGLQHWSALEGFAAWANCVDGIRADPKLRLFRAAGGQRARAERAGDFEPDCDLFYAAADLTGGSLAEVASDALNREKREPACVLDGALRSATLRFTLTAERAAGAHELRIRARRNERAGRLALTLNGTTIFNGAVPFGEMESTAATFPVPRGLLREKENTLTLQLALRESELEIDAGDEGLEPDAPPLAINYVVLKPLAEGGPGGGRR